MKVKGLQYVLYLVNLLLFVFGWIFIICGAVIMNRPDISNCGYVQETSVYMIVAGCVTVLVSLVGCLGVSQKNVCLLLVFAALLFLVFFLCLILLIIAFTLRDKVGDDVLVRMRQDMNSSRDVEYIERIQRYHKCCGIDDWLDWRANPIFLRPTKTLPLSCCSNGPKVCTQDSKSLYKKGCGEKYKWSVGKYLKVIGAIATSAAIFVLIEILLILFLVHAIRAEYNAV